MESKQRIYLALGPIGQAVQDILGGDVLENAADIFQIIAEQPDATPDEIAKTIKNNAWRDNPGSILSGFCDGRRAGPWLESGVAGDDDGKIVLEPLDPSGEPEARIEAREFLEQFGEKGEEIIRRAEALRDEIEELQTKSGAAWAQKWNVSRRQGFEIKAQRLAKSRAALEKLRAHLDFCLEHGIRNAAEAATNFHESGRRPG